MLNSFWGKFGQRENLRQSVMIGDPFMLYDIIYYANQSEYLCEFHSRHKRRCISRVEHVGEAIEPSPNANVVIAAYTTAHARYFIQLPDTTW